MITKCGEYASQSVAGVTCLRFNFRGVEGSEGSHDEGRGERQDVLAAIRDLTGVDLRPTREFPADGAAGELPELFGQPDARLERVHTVLELSIAWLLSRPSVASVIAGATKPEQIAANVAAGGWKPSSETLAQVDVIAPR